MDLSSPGGAHVNDRIDKHHLFLWQLQTPYSGSCKRMEYFMQTTTLMTSSQRERVRQTSTARTLLMHKSCEATGTPVEPEKSIGPTTIIDFLIIELDTEVMEIRLPADKLGEIGSVTQ